MAPPTKIEPFNQLFCKLAVFDRKQGTIYTDLTGKFPLRSMDVMSAIFILYDWTSNAILATPIPNATDTAMVEAFKKNIEYLAPHGFKPKFNVMDNVASKTIKKYF